MPLLALTARADARALIALSLALPGCFGTPDAKEAGLAAASITDPRDGAAVERGAEVRFLGVAGDGTSVEGLTATWTAASDATPDATTEVCPPVAPAADGATACTFVPSEVGNLVCLRVDSPTAQASDCVTVSIVDATGAPTVSIESPDADGVYYADEDVLLVVTASDEVDSFSELTVGWTSSIDGDLGEAADLDASGRSVREVGLSGGTHVLTATVTDTQGLASSAEVTIDVAAQNSPPSCTITSPGDGATSPPRTPITFVGQVTDPDIPENMLDAGWESDRDGRLYLGPVDATGRTEFTTDQLSDGTHRISLIAADERGERCEDMILLAVTSPPTVEILEPLDDASFSRGQPITFVGTVTDGDDAPETLDIEWISNIDKLLDTTPADRDGVATFTTDALSEGNHTITFVAIDPEGSISRMRIRITVGGCGDSLWYADVDGDGYGDPEVVSGECDPPLGYVDNALDCDDTDPNARPSGTEVCNGVDDDCDSFVDEAEAVDPVTWHADDDRDGYGDPAVIAVQCEAPAGYVRDGTDCDDSRVSTYPGADEVPGDGLDQDCDGVESCWVDGDGDGVAGTVRAGADLDCADAGEHPTGEDCDDADRAVYPGATERCDGVDEDCDGAIDEDAGDLLSWYADVDGDGYGDPTSVIDSCDAPAGHVDNAEDCDDGDAAVRPGAAEDCDGIDDDCDGERDEGFTRSAFHPDGDGDGYGDPAVTVDACVVPPGHVTDATDCDDSDATVSPAGTELPADGKDGDCDGREDCYVDADRDRYGSTTVATGDNLDCMDPREADNADDCDDTDAARNPGELEVCNGVDDNCDALTDDATAVDATTWYADLDGDLYGDDDAALAACDAPAGHVVDAGDCDDADPAKYPGALDECNGEDDDCDEEIDEDVPRSTWYADRDADGHGNNVQTVLACVAPSGFVSSNDDCDDANAGRNPSAEEVPGDGVDQSCDGLEACWVDLDGDGYGTAEVVASDDLACDAAGESGATGDCDDTTVDRNPGVTEVCNGVDDDCDGVDDDDASDATVYYTDADGDTYGDPATAIRSCTPLTGFVLDGSDCDDTRATSYPGAYDACDGLDNNCDGEVDEATAEGRPTWYADADGDGYGDAASTAPGCSAPTGYVADATDCDDDRATTYPGAPETIADGVDQSCDGRELCYLDLDRDGYGTEATRASADLDCTGNLESPASTDCDDEDGDVHPGADEYCNTLDDDCDGTVDESSAIDAIEWFVDADLDGYGDGTTGVWSCDLPEGRTSDDQDCDDGDAAVRPGATELASDEVDQDCDGLELCQQDADHDGYGDDGGALTSSADLDCRDEGEALDLTDCDDTNETIHPDAPEVVADRIDQDCSGADVCWADVDGDGYGSEVLVESPDGVCTSAGESAVSGDCDDAAAAVNPAAAEVCDGIDNNCEGTADGAEADGAVIWYADDDADGYGTVDLYTLACSAPAGFVGDLTDCDDADASVNPGEVERCATVADDDCDGSTERIGADDCVDWFVDADGDGWGDGSPSCRCNEGDGYTALQVGDCAPSDAAIHPGADEICDPADVDEDCDGLADDGDDSVVDQGRWVVDADGDGFGDDSTAVASCDALEGRITQGGDCDEADAGVNPGQAEVCLDGIDQDCDGEDCGWDGDYAVDDPAEYASRIVGSSGSMRYGSDLDAQGDFDGDGVVDLVVVAGFDTTGGSSYGSVFVHRLPVPEGDLGSSDANALLYGDSTSAKIDAAFGVPDISGDGLDELYIRRGDGSGALILGGFPDGTQAWNASVYLTGTCVDVDGAGQWNGIGNDEWLCGDPTTSSDAGSVYVYNGVNVYGRLNGETAEDEAGFSVAGGPDNDVDGDGTDDIWIGAFGDDDMGSDAGAAYLVYGPVFGTASLGTADNKIVGAAAGDELGWQVHRAGDVDLDGRPDVLVGAPGADGGGSASGEVYLFANSDTATGPADALATFIGADQSDDLGSFGMNTGDVDGDGYLDTLLCSPWNDAFGASTGTAWLVFGPLSGTYDLAALSGHHARFYGSHVLDYVGADCSIVADVDADGKDEIAVTGWGYDSGSTFFNGALWLLPGE